jgi:hypothetical protein
VDEALAAVARVVPYVQADGVLRRCNRCLRNLLDDGSVVTRPNWWLCAPCHAALLPGTVRARTETEAARS